MMKKLLYFTLLFLILLLPVKAQTFAEFEQGFSNFSANMANSLPFNALTGHQCSDAYIGEFPHMIVGAAVGVAVVPFNTIKPVLDTFGISLSSELSFIENMGVPLPIFTIDMKFGFYFLPIDIGIIFGILPGCTHSFISNDMSFDYLLVGADARYALIIEDLMLPDISVGAGFYYLSGEMKIKGLFGSDPEITDLDLHTIWLLNNPDLIFNWQTTIIDLKAQASKNFSIFTPFIGLGASLGISKAGGGLESQERIVFDGSEITQENIDSINASMGDEAPDLSFTGILVDSAVNGWAFRVFGGVSIKLAIFYLSSNVMYNFTSQAYSGSINLRFQL